MIGDEKQNVSAQPEKGFGPDFLLPEEGREAGDLPRLTLALIGGTHAWEDAVSRVLEDGVRAIDKSPQSHNGPFTRAMDYALEDAGFFTVQSFAAQVTSGSDENRPAGHENGRRASYASYDVAGGVIDLIPQETKVF